jgi:pimeloyl-ACP methyl ester carboxylesterase/DNA-binding CsgD family transcriptional regulator
VTTSAYPIRFCKTADGVQIAYAVGGNGLNLVKTPTWLNHLELDVTTPVWRPWIEQMSRTFRLVRYDARGCGLSDRNIQSNSFATYGLDLEAVVNATGMRRFALFGASQGGPIAIDYAARHPEQVSHLILYGTYLRGSLKRDASPQAVEQAHLMLKLVELGWGQDNSAFRQVFAAQFIPDSTLEQLRAFDEIQRQTVSPETATRLLASFYEIDVSSQACKLVCPTIVLHSRDDARIPFEEGRKVASAIQGAEFVSLQSRNHILLDHQPAWHQFFDEIAGFMMRHHEKVSNVHPDVAGLSGREHDSLPNRDGKRIGEDLHDLSARELEVLDLIARGMDNDQIAARLALSPKTVRNHITKIFSKLEIYTRAKAVVVAREAGLGLTALK